MGTQHGLQIGDETMEDIWMTLNPQTPYTLLSIRVRPEQVVNHTL